MSIGPMSCGLCGALESHVCEDTVLNNGCADLQAVEDVWLKRYGCVHLPQNLQFVWTGAIAFRDSTSNVVTAIPLPSSDCATLRKHINIHQLLNSLITSIISGTSNDTMVPASILPASADPTDYPTFDCDELDTSDCGVMDSLCTTSFVGVVCPEHCKMCMNPIQTDAVTSGPITPGTMPDATADDTTKPPATGAMDTSSAAADSMSSAASDTTMPPVASTAAAPVCSDHLNGMDCSALPNVCGSVMAHSLCARSTVVCARQVKTVMLRVTVRLMILLLTSHNHTLAATTESLAKATERDRGGAKQCDTSDSRWSSSIIELSTFCYARHFHVELRTPPDPLPSSFPVTLGKRCQLIVSGGAYLFSSLLRRNPLRQQNVRETLRHSDRQASSAKTGNKNSELKSIACYGLTNRVSWLSTSGSISNSSLPSSKTPFSLPASCISSKAAAMLPGGVLGKSAAVPALLALLALLSSRVAFTLAGSGHSREAPDSTLDIGRLLFKQMRFRDLSSANHERVRARSPVFRLWLGYRPWRERDATTQLHTSRTALNKVLKRENDKMIVDNLAALISNMKGRDTNSQMRMPSLRFG
ncbi:hypothetical protein RRG08_021019 [Elysia crispata]|uniref:ShKT domain-containing protein n=1 Tax=Elysia crispata TaxID=231223 RepID=A0AAE1EF77_9GAST|nr:hypothetical protein RRG08_021019 [Elysia crispata]